MVHEGHPVKRPTMQDSINYGKYLTSAAACIDCHTPVTGKGELVMDKAFSGNREFPLEGGGSIFSTNITFDKNTGIGNWDKNRFIHVFKSYDLSSYVPAKIEKGDINTLMPWTMFAKMDTVDLVAIYQYLKSLPAIESTVAKSK